MFQLKPRQLANFVLWLTKTTEIDWDSKSGVSFDLVSAKTYGFQLKLEMLVRNQCKNLVIITVTVSFLGSIFNFLFCASFISSCLMQAWCLSWWLLVCSNFRFSSIFLLLAQMDAPSVSRVNISSCSLVNAVSSALALASFYTFNILWCFAFFSSHVHNLDYNFFKVAVLYLFLTVAYLLLIIRIKCL